MSDIKRYELFYDEDYDAPRMQTAESGTYTRYEDHLVAMRELRGKLHSQEWKPMETAPKDGRWVILYWANEVTPGFYLDNSKTVYPWEGWSRGSGQVMLKGVPTSWMPFPTYP